MPWYRDIAKASLIACVASAVSLAIPLREAVRNVFELQIVAAPALALVALVTLSLPMFYLCLFRDLQGRELLLSKRIQLLSSAAALALIASTAANLPAWIRSFAPGPAVSVLTARESWLTAHLSTILNGLSNLACILPLIALSTQPAAESGLRTSVSTLLRVVTAVAAVAFGLLAAFSALRLILAPWILAPAPASVAGAAARTLLEQFGLFVAPYVVWRSTSRCDRSQT